MKYCFLLLFLFCFQACQPAADTATKKAPTTNKTTDTKSFDPATSDAKAITLADEVMEAMGGQEKWEDLQYISWNFFKARDLVWDKKNNRVRIEVKRDSSIYLLNMNTMEGKVWRNGTAMSQPDSVNKYLKFAKNMWINDSYWLVMPFKLKDPGVSLKYLRSDTTQAGAPAEVVQLTFNEVGNTPNNKYEVYIDQKDKLIKQWAFYSKAEQEKPSAIWPWDNYKPYNGVLLSSDRSDDRGPFEVKVYQTLPAVVFEDLQAKWKQ